jgi:hypothetical protein
MVIARPRKAVPIMGATAVHATEPMAYQPSVVIETPCGEISIGTWLPPRLCPSAGVMAPKTVAIASIAAVAIRRMVHPLPAGKTGSDILHRA